MNFSLDLKKIGVPCANKECSNNIFGVPYYLFSDGKPVCSSLCFNERTDKLKRDTKNNYDSQGYS